MKGFLTTQEAAEALGVNDSRVRQMIRAGIIRAERVGRAHLIPEDALEQARQRKTKRGPASASEQAVPKKSASKRK